MFMRVEQKLGVVRLLTLSLLFTLTKQGRGVRIQGDEFWHMTKVLRLSARDRYFLI